MNNAPPCGHKYWLMFGETCGPCFHAYWSSILPVGTPVTYDDEDIDNLSTDARGVVAEPNAEELAYAKKYSDPTGPEAGDLLVQWKNDPESRYWEDPTVLRALPQSSSPG